MRCQLCGNGTGLCSSDDDNGQSTECTSGLDIDACWYYQAVTVAGGQKETFRLCGHKLPEKCVSDTLPGVSATICNCDTDNCNKDHECDCSLITSTQGTTQDWDKTTWTTQATTKTTSSTTTQTTTKTTATSSSSTIGISALASLVSTTASLLISLSS